MCHRGVLATATRQMMEQSVHPLVATAIVGNAASVRVLQKAGVRFKRILPGNDQIDGESVDGRGIWVQPSYSVSTVQPVVLRASRSRCACCTSASA